MKGMFEILAPLLAWDAALFKFINSHHAGLFDALFWGCSTFGSAWVIIPSYLLFILLASGRRRLWTILIASAVTLISGAVMDEIIKNGVNRPRPLAHFEVRGSESDSAGPADTSEAFEVHNIGPALRRNSFPSGHSWTAFAIATLILLFFGRKYRWIYLAAAAIAYSRIYVGVHFPLDVLGGACGGTLLALFAWRMTPQKARHIESRQP